MGVSESVAAPEVGGSDVEKDLAGPAVGMIEVNIDMAGPEVVAEAVSNVSGGKSDSSIYSNLYSHRCNNNLESPNLIRGKGKAQNPSKGKSSVKGDRKTSQKAPKTQKVRKQWRFKAGDDIPGILDEGENSYKPTGIHKEFLEFAKSFWTVEKGLTA